MAVEAPLSLVIDGAVVATTMRTPGHDVELALGWLVGEGVLARRDDVVAVRAGDERTVEIALAPGAQPPGRRLGVTVSACGLCGVDDLDAVTTRLDSAARADGATSVDVEVLLSLPERLRAAQPLFDRTGGLHAAGWFSRAGDVLLVREDVGRHNALDKLVGALWERDQLPAADGLLCLSGRASYELVAKAVVARDARRRRGLGPLDRSRRPGPRARDHAGRIRAQGRGQRLRRRAAPGGCLRPKGSGRCRSRAGVAVPTLPLSRA